MTEPLTGTELVRTLISPLAGYAIYAIIATFTSWDYWPTSTGQWAALGGLIFAGVIGNSMEIGEERARRRRERYGSYLP